LGLGVGANTAIFSVVQSVLLRPLPYRQPETLIQIWNTYFPIFPKIEMSPGDYQDLRRQARSFSETAGYVSIAQGFNLTGAGEPTRLQAAYATSALFPLLGSRPAVGRTFTADEDKPGTAPALILSHRFWQSRFGGDASVVGRTLSLDGTGYLVAGVAPADFELLRWADVWLPIGCYSDDPASHIHHEFSVVVRLKPGVTLAQAQAELDTFNRQEQMSLPDTHKNFGMLAEPLHDASAASIRLALLVLFAAVGLILLIACVNIVNLLLARNAARQREIALRIALGSNRWRLIRQLLTESTLLAFSGGALGLLFALAALRALNASAPANVAIVKQAGLNFTVLGFTLAACLLVGIACGLVPALQTLRQDIQSVLKEGTRSSSASWGEKVRSLLVVSEIALALVPLVGAGLLIRSFQRILAVDPGFRPDSVLTMEVDQPALSSQAAAKLSNDQQIEYARRQSREFEQMADRIRALPGVTAVGGINELPLVPGLRSASRFQVEGQPLPPSGLRPVAETRQATIGYFAATGIPLRSGRMLDARDYGGQNILINEAMARRYLTGQDPLGKRINLCTLAPKPCWFPIVGVVGDVRQHGLDAAPTYDVYFTGGWSHHLVVRTSSNPSALARAVVQEVHKADPSLPVANVMALDDVLSDSVSSRRFSTLLLGLFAALGLLLAAVGVYGVMSYAVSLRTGEIGIRMALGAQPANIWTLILGRGARLALAGVALGLIGAFALTKLIAGMLFGVQPNDALSFGVMALLLISIALAACYVPARRAMRLDPVVALRHE
jgi:putative ABC transport system permease protein